VLRQTSGRRLLIEFPAKPVTNSDQAQLVDRI
jgi:hypothetical protein